MCQRERGQINDAPLGELHRERGGARELCAGVAWGAKTGRASKWTISNRVIANIGRLSNERAVYIRKRGQRKEGNLLRRAGGAEADRANVRVDMKIGGVGSGARSGKRRGCVMRGRIRYFDLFEPRKIK